MKKLVGILLLFLYSCVLPAQTKKNGISLELKFEVTPHSKSVPDSIIINYAYYPVKLWSTWTRKARHNGSAKWVIPADQPIILDIYFREGVPTADRYKRLLLEPGDSIIVKSRDEELHFSGHGADKLNMNNEIFALKNAMPKPSNPTIYSVVSVEDFLEWDNYLNRRMALSEFIMESYKSLVSPLAMYHTKVETIIEIEDQRWEKFKRLSLKKYFDLDRQKISKLYDEHFYTTQAKWIWEQASYLTRQLPLDGRYLRKHDFAPIAEIADSKVERKMLYWEFAKKELRGEGLEAFLAFYLTYYIIGKEGFSPEVDSTLQKYYADKDRETEYQAYVKDYERKERVLKKYRTVPGFSVYKSKKKAYHKNDLQEKIVVLNFFKDGNNASKAMTKSLEKIASKFKSDPYVKFLNLPVSLQPDSVIRKFNLTSYPAVFIMDLTGRLISSSFIDSTQDAAKINEIVADRANVAKREAWQGNTDGPYVLGQGPTKKIYQFIKGKLDNSNSNKTSFQVATDLPGKYFFVNLRNDHKVEPSVFPKPEKLLAFSDIEGEFEALRLLLQKNGVIDENYNWRFGKGHLVFAGDMFDRGEQVTECLWLIYSLEVKAKAAGGYVHFILGNHEIMNLSGDHRYARDKYKENAKGIGKSLVELYGKDSELGRWLRSKNIIEKIGSLLFLHAGISKDVNDMGLTISQVNELARPWYDNSTDAKKSGDRRLELLYDSDLSPFWYRDYYLDQEVKSGSGGNKIHVAYKTPENVIDDILKRYEVNKIITGHTVWEGVKNDADRGKWISVHYDGKIINTDTHHKRGYSEALLIENGQYYAVNKNGEKRELINGSALNEQIVVK